MSSKLFIFENMLRPLKTRVALMISRAVIFLVDDGKKFQSLTAAIMAGEVDDSVERVQNFGFTGNPPPNAEAIILFPNGDRSNPIAIAVDARDFRLMGLQPGESAMYNLTGAYAWLKLTEFEVTSPQIKLGSVGLEPLLKGTTFQTGYNTHTHNGNLGAPTGVPLVPSTALDLTLITQAG